MSIDVSKLQVDLEEGERWRRTLSITVPAEIVATERNAAVRKLSSRIQLPGFREGKVPASVVERRFGPALNQELVDRVIGEAYRGVLKDRELRPISEGEVGEIEYKPESDLSFSISFDIAPQVELARVAGFKVTRPSIPVGDAEVEKVLERVREQHGTWKPVEEGAPEEGDMVAVRIQRLTEEGDEPRRYEFTLGKGEAIPDVERAITSLEVGQSEEFTVTFPEDFPNEERRGDADELRIYLDSRKVMDLPELDDELAAQVGDFDSVDALRERIREDLEKEAADEAESAVRGRLLEQLLSANPFEVPQSMIDQYIRSLAGEDQELSDEDLAQAREEFGPQAEGAVKRFIVIEELARSKELEATPDEVDERIEEIAERSDSTPGEVYARLQKAGQIERLEREITERKVFDFLKSESTITDES
jgi:trigger factor